MTLQGGSCYIYPRGDAYRGDLYAKTGSGYVKLNRTLYYGGAQVHRYYAGDDYTFTKQGATYSTALYFDGGSETVTLQGTQYSTALYQDGGSETVTLQGEEATTETVTALVAG